MKFFILGDSWGVGEWNKNDGMLTPVPDTGIDFWLKNLNHYCTNISSGSASNFGQLRHAYWTLEEDFDYDYIVWFYTEPFRDIIETVINDPEEAKIQYPDFDPSDFPRCDYITKQNLEYAQMIYNKFSIPFIVIGGQCRLPKKISDYSFCYKKINNWAAELLDIDFEFPEYTWFSWKKFEIIFDYFDISSKKFIIDEFENLNKVSIILEKSELSDKFPDDAHPGRDEFKNLAERVVDTLLE
jgi:hypothetical protein